jgi:hypothetical protein
MKKIEDYLPLYIGCQVMTPDGEAKLLGISGGVFGIDKADVHFGSKMIKTKSSCDGGYNKTRNHGSYMIKAQSLVAIATTDPDFNEIDLPGGVVPILRPLDSMTEEEAKYIIDNYFFGSIDLERDEKKFAINIVTRLSQQMEVARYLLSRGFDLFNLIPDGLALNRNTI